MALLKFSWKAWSVCHNALSWQSLKSELRRRLSGQLLKYLLSTLRSAAVYWHLALESVEFLSRLWPKIVGDFTLTFWGFYSLLCNCCFQVFPILISQPPWEPSLRSLIPQFVKLRLSMDRGARRAQLYRRGSLLLPRVASLTVFAAKMNETIAPYLSRSYWTFTGFVPWVSPRLPRFHLVFFGNLLSCLSHPSAIWS